MRDRTDDRRALQDSMLSARLVDHVARQLRPVCVGARRKDFFKFVVAVVEVHMRQYAALPPS